MTVMLESRFQEGSIISKALNFISDRPLFGPTNLHLAPTTNLHFKPTDVVNATSTGDSFKDCLSLGSCLGLLILAAGGLTLVLSQ